jgi:hypothetical protein
MVMDRLGDAPAKLNELTRETRSVFRTVDSESRPPNLGGIGARGAVNVTFRLGSDTPSATGALSDKNGSGRAGAEEAFL